MSFLNGVLKDKKLWGDFCADAKWWIGQNDQKLSTRSDVQFTLVHRQKLFAVIVQKFMFTAWHHLLSASHPLWNEPFYPKLQFAERTLFFIHVHAMCSNTPWKIICLLKIMNSLSWKTLSHLEIIHQILHLDLFAIHCFFCCSCILLNVGRVPWHPWCLLRLSMQDKMITLSLDGVALQHNATFWRRRRTAR